MGEKENFKLACATYLQTISVSSLRTYGRSLGLQKPTALKKATLIQQIIQALCGEISPMRGKLGAPAKDVCVEPSLLKNIDALRKNYHVEQILPVFIPPVENEKKIKKEPPVVINISLQFSELTDKQKEGLKAFLQVL